MMIAFAVFIPLLFFIFFKKKLKKHKTIYLSVALAIAWRQMHRERNGAEKHSISIMELIRCRKIVTKYEHTQSFYPQFHSIYWQFFNYIGPFCIENRFKFNWNHIWEKWKTRFTALFIPLNKCLFSNSECFCRLNRIQKE